ncbi:MAG: hypothetical protein EOP62_11760 [Sphingomonadales bacterium]|nr:MAG: hypothetical protein EOP62_11760 [Sphingomonadales bacterium]
MNEEVTVAVLRLQDSLMKGRLQPWRAEQTEEALNGLLTKPYRIGDPFHLERNAMSDARKKLQRREALFADHIAEIDVMAEGDNTGGRPNAEPFDILRADVVDMIDRTSSDVDREILAIALEGGSAAEVAETLGIDYDIAKVRLSRARQRARVAWGNA